MSLPDRAATCLAGEIATDAVMAECSGLALAQDERDSFFLGTEQIGQ